MANSSFSDDSPHDVSAHSEHTPLLATTPTPPTSNPANTDANTDANTNPSINNDDRPLPKTQILLLCYARVVEPIAFFGIFPFVNQMVQKNGDLQTSEVGFYSGLIESLFSLTQMAVMIFWGRASDRVGRKPVLVVSMVGVAVMSAAFGLATTIWQMVLFRCMAGVFAGSVVTIRTMITELSTSKTQARAFSFFAFANNISIFVGPLIGGALADPAAQYGGVFERLGFFYRFPYALATFTTGFIGITACVVVALFVEETLPAKKGLRAESGDGKSKDQEMSVWELVRSPGVADVLYLYCHVMMLAFAYTAVIAVFWFTPVQLGGFGFTSFQISLWMALTGASQVVWGLLAFPPLHKRYGTGWILRICSFGYVVFIPLMPLLNLLLRHADAHNTTWERTVFWTAGSVIMFFVVGVSMGFIAIQLAVNDICPTPALLGTLNGLALALVSGFRAFSPALFSSIFAIGVTKHIAGGSLFWIVFWILCVIYVFLANDLPAKAGGRLRKDTTGGA